MHERNGKEGRSKKIRERSTPLRILMRQVLPVLVIAYAVVIVAVYSIPHLPLANIRTFHSMLKAQMTVDHSEELQANGKKMLLFLGSSVVERGVPEHYLDTLLHQEGLTYFETSNSGTGGFFSKANLPMFRAMLERGLKPSRVVYGFFLQEFNAHSAAHSNVKDEDTSTLKLREKTIWNVIRYGPTAVAPMLDATSLHQYLFAANHAFREVRNPDFLDKLMFGQNMFERDSTFVLSMQDVEYLKEIYQLCKEKDIPFALFNTPIRPTIESITDLPYLHREENYRTVQEFALANNIPIWNFDQPGFFTDVDFQDTYHLTPNGARKLSTMLAEHILYWTKGGLQQDPLSTFRATPIALLHSK